MKSEYGNGLWIDRETESLLVMRDWNGKIAGKLVRRRAECGELRWYYCFWSDRKLSRPYKRKEYAVKAARKIWRERCQGKLN